MYKSYFYTARKKEMMYKKFPLGIKVGCGKCYSCRAKKSMEKTIRFIHEYETLKKKENWKIFFITITFSNDKIKEAHKTKDGELTLNKDWVRKKETQYIVNYIENTKKQEQSFIKCTNT